MRATILLMPVLAAACVAAPPRGGLAAPDPVFSAERFFSGRTEGEASLKIIFKHSQPVRVHGVGHVEPDGTLVLVQQVEQAGKPPSRREWRIRPDGPGRYTGTLTGATGIVTGKVAGNRLSLRFSGKGGLHYRQWLYLESGGQVARNRMTVRKMGIRVASLSETITRQGE
jgi:hypothetical protein